MEEMEEMEGVEGNSPQDVAMGGVDGSDDQDVAMGGVDDNTAQDAAMGGVDNSDTADIKMEEVDVTSFQDVGTLDAGEGSSRGTNVFNPGSTRHAHVQEAQHLDPEKSSQAHLKVINQARYSKSPKFRHSTVTSRQGLLFTSNLRWEPTEKNKGGSKVSRSIAKNPNYNTKKFDAKITLKNEVIFDSSILDRESSALSDNIDSLDHFLRQCRSQPRQNNSRFQVAPEGRCNRGQNLVLWLDDSNLTTCGTPPGMISWNVGAMGPGQRFFQVDPNEIQTLLDRLCYILQRLKPIEFSDKQARSRFLFCILNRLIRHANPAFKLKAVITDSLSRQPRKVLPNRSREDNLSLSVVGFEIKETKWELYRFVMSFTPSHLSSKPIQVPFEDRYEGIQLRDPEQSEDSASDPESLFLSRRQRRAHAQRRVLSVGPSVEQVRMLARKIMYTTEGFLGQSSTLQRIVEEMKIAQCIGEPGHQRRFGFYGGKHTIWHFKPITSAAGGSMAYTSP